MCGIVGAVAQRPVAGILLEGLKRLEYRGYDSAGIATLEAGTIRTTKAVGKVAALEEALQPIPHAGSLGIAHTRWATHGKPSEANAHPHTSGERLALVHNGIIENHQELRQELQGRGYQFRSETDTEVIVHLLHRVLTEGAPNLLQAVQSILPKLQGAYGLAVIDRDEPGRLVCARSGSPLVIGVGIGENFIASDQLALRQVTDRVIYLEEGDIASLSLDCFEIYDASGLKVEREIVRLQDGHEVADKGRYRHFMMKEIYEQVRVVGNTLQGRLGQHKVLDVSLGESVPDLFAKVEAIQIVACGTSYHAGMVARYWIEEMAGIPCNVEVASEFRYRKFAVRPNTLFVTISQSGETADTLAALRLADTLGFMASLAICNVPSSSLVRESDIAIMTEAGPEIGVASTKAFTTQLTALLLLSTSLARYHGLAETTEAEIVDALRQLPELIAKCLDLDPQIAAISEHFADKHHALFLGRGVLYPVAQEGALKLKEISYIHAESYPAGELKHGPLALVDADMPVVAVAPNDELLEKLHSNLQEVRARGGELFVFADTEARFPSEEGVHVIELPHVPEILVPIVYTVPLQLLSYHVAILKGTDVDQPRNLAKSVTVE